MAQQALRLTPAQVALAAKPGWRVAPSVYGVDSPGSNFKADASLPEVKDLLNKYFGSDSADSSADSLAQSGDDEGLVSMESENSSDIRAGRKVTYVSEGEVRGDQG